VCLQERVCESVCENERESECERKPERECVRESVRECVRECVRDIFTTKLSPPAMYPENECVLGRERGSEAVYEREREIESE